MVNIFNGQKLKIEDMVRRAWVTDWVCSLFISWSLLAVALSSWLKCSPIVRGERVNMKSYVTCDVGQPADVGSRQLHAAHQADVCF
jgi:hypothetical protein